MIPTSQLNLLKQWHSEAMDLAESAIVFKIEGLSDEAAKATRRAFLLEKRAAILCSQFEDYEPTRSVLLRSAASLAIDCGDFHEAESLITLGLAGHPPEEVAGELRELHAKVTIGSLGVAD